VTSFFKLLAQCRQQMNLPACYQQNSFNAELQKGSCGEYQLLKSFKLTRRGNRIQVYRLRGGRSTRRLDFFKFLLKS